MKLNKLQINVVNNFLNLLVIEVANSYLNNLKNFKTNEVDEIVLEFLDGSVFLAEEKIDITNAKNNAKIQKMTKKESEKFNKALNKKNSYYSLSKMLNFIYVVIKEEEEEQANLFKNLYFWYEKKEDDLIENQDLDIYKEIKPWLANYNKNNNLYNGQHKI